MIKKRRIIGVCISEINKDLKPLQIEALNREFGKEGCKLIVYNSLINEYDNGGAYEQGSLAVFKTVNLDLLDALIIIGRGFCSKNVISELISKANDKGLPVVVINEQIEGCYCILDDFGTAYTNLIRHIIKDHKVRDLFFMGGYRWSKETLDRLACFKKALGKENLNFDDSMVGYGDFWDEPAVEELNRILAQRKTPPGAIICANDFMAMAVIRRLQALSIKVPEDVLVTGFDGIEEGRYFIPNLTTVREDVDAEAKACVEMLKDIFDGKEVKKILKIPYRVIYNESCGCTSEEKYEHYRERMAETMRVGRLFEGHERKVYDGVERFLAAEDVPSMLEALYNYGMIENSYLCLKSVLLDSLNAMYGSGMDFDVDKDYYVISSESDEEFGALPDSFGKDDLLPEMDSWLEDDSICIVNSLYADSYRYGLFFYKTSEVWGRSCSANRISRALNLSFTTVYNRMIQKGMQMELEQAIYTDPISTLPNLKGIEKWFDSFAEDKLNHEKRIGVILFKIDRYRYIYDNYGMNEVEEMIDVITRLLNHSGQRTEYLARTADDEFVIIDYTTENEGKGLIDEAVRKTVNEVTSAVENYNAMHIKDYRLELNTGYTIAAPGWNTDFRSLLRLANGELYLNILRNEKKYSSQNSEDNGEDHYEELLLVLEKNLLVYHFQPIVDMRTGEIYAYEALMRTTGGIDVPPPTLLKTAAKYNKLYELEKMTLFGIMDYYSANFEKFKGRRVFINSIPGNFLTDEDFAEFVSKYKDYVQYIVFEITEHDSISDGELGKIKRITVDDMNGMLAVDDYGTGQSNIENLLRYSPNIVKIDRFLIQDIYKEPNKQLFMSNIIEFARMNNMQVVGEGVENSEEFKTVMEYGVDFVQGFFTARPCDEPLEALPDSILNAVEILKNANKT